MKLLEALELVGETRAADKRAFVVSLVCGFNPLHFQTFLTAEFHRRRTDRKPDVRAGLYGDFWGNLNRAAERECDAVVIALEWADLDPRLGLRSLGGWTPSLLPEIVEAVQGRARHLAAEASRLARQAPIAVSLPTLPLPPIASTPGWLSSTFELEVKASVANLAVELSRTANIRLVGQQRLDQLSPLAERADVRAEVTTGFPYQLKHASTLAELISQSMAEAPSKKGLITDLDDTLWRGIVGEVGAAGISWDLDHRSQVHGLYQQFLSSLAAAGVLIGVASKNDQAVVAQAFERGDMLLSQTSIFPLEATWGAKSESVGRILKAWNIAADAVVFVDDSPTEIAEVQAVHPGVEGIAFPVNDPQKLFCIMQRLRDLFGKTSITEEDALRSQSLRQSSRRNENSNHPAGSPETFLREAAGELDVTYANESDPRAFELVNKTNQFNLNGRRFTSADWQKRFSTPGTFCQVVSYRDKYGPLGKIAACLGRVENDVVFVDGWVLSCRAFGRRIEHACLASLFEKFDVAAIEFDFQATDRNGPLQMFLGDLLGKPPAGRIRLPKNSFQEKRVETFHTVRNSDE